jgi:hypothetical protein
VITQTAMSGDLRGFPPRSIIDDVFGKAETKGNTLLGGADFTPDQFFVNGPLNERPAITYKNGPRCDTTRKP